MDVLTPPETLVDLLARRADLAADTELVRFADNRRLTVGELAERSRWLARQMAGLVQPGDVVVTAFAPGPDQLVTIFALGWLGAVELPVATSATPSTVAEVLASAKPVAAAIDYAYVRANPPVADLLRARLRTVAVAGDVENTIAVDELGAGRLPSPPSPGDPAVIMMTSGTTGRPKGAVLPHFAAIRHGRRVTSTMRYEPGDVLFNVFPWHHVNVRHTALLPALMSGARLVSHPRFSASHFWDVCRTEAVTAFNFMGALVAILARQAPSDLDRDHLLRRGYGGPAPESLCRLFAQRFGVDLFEAYASTELGDVATNTPQAHRWGTAGRIVPEYDVRILDAAGQPLPAGHTGQLAVRANAPQIRFLGYVGGTPAGPPPDGWFVTGDRALLSEDGYLQFRGRRSDVIRRRGENISAWEVEEVLAALPGVIDAAVVGIASELTEEDVLAAISTAPGADVDAQAVRDWCVSHLPIHCVPRYVWIGPELPRNRSGKIVKADLRSEETLCQALDFEPTR